MSGAWVFRGTRVPVRARFENLESGATVDQFMEWFPGVTAEQVAAVLAHAETVLLKHSFGGFEIQFVAERRMSLAGPFKVRYDAAHPHSSRQRRLKNQAYKFRFCRVHSSLTRREPHFPVGTVA